MPDILSFHGKQCNIRFLLLFHSSMTLLSPGAVTGVLETLKVKNVDEVATSIGKLEGGALTTMHELLTRVATDQSPTKGVTVKKLLVREHGAVVENPTE